MTDVRVKEVSVSGGVVSVRFSIIHGDNGVWIEMPVAEAARLQALLLLAVADDANHG